MSIEVYLLILVGVLTGWVWNLSRRLAGLDKHMDFHCASLSQNLDTHDEFVKIIQSQNELVEIQQDRVSKLITQLKDKGVIS